METILKELSEIEFRVLLGQILQFLVWVAFILVLSWLTRKGVNKAFTDNAIRYRIRKVIRLISYALISFLAITTFMGKAQYFTIVIGLVAAGVAFALQEVILSLAGWVAIFGSGLYKTGDRIEINGIRGDVIDIGITKTTLMEIGQWISTDNYNGRIVQISNSFVFKGAVNNYSSDFPFLWDEINLPVRYGSDLQLAEKIILEIAQNQLAEYAEFAKEHWKAMVNKYLIENANIEPTLTVQLNDNWMTFNLRYVVDYKQRRITKNRLYTEILEAIQRTEGKVALASATYEVVGIPELNVNLKKE